MSREAAAIETHVPAVVLNLGDHGSLGIARSLGRLGVRVHGVHTDRSPASRSRYFEEVLGAEVSPSGALRWPEPAPDGGAPPGP